MRVLENVLLSSLTTFRTGGPARFLLLLDDASELKEAVAFANEKKLSLVPLGGGSNMLAPDRGMDAVFARFLAQALSITPRSDAARLTADAGLSWDELVSAACARGLWGVENLSAIPGTVGAAVVQNIGAYGAALEETLVSVEAFDCEKQEWRTFTRSECAFGYRTSIFKVERDRYFITKVTLELSERPKPNISYRDLKNHFEVSAEKPTLENIRSAVTLVRAGKFPPLSEFGTAGSFFLNPVMSEEKAIGMQKAHPGMPLFPMPEGGFKVPLAWLIDRALSLKGERAGGAFLWEKQPIVVTAQTGATTGDVIELATRVISLVKEKIGIEIHPEVRILSREDEF